MRLWLLRLLGRLLRFGEQSPSRTRPTWVFILIAVVISVGIPLLVWFVPEFRRFGPQETER